MKIQFIKSIKAKVDESIDRYNVLDIDYIFLDKTEYIQFLEEICMTDRIILTLADKTYRGIQIKVGPE